MPTKLLFVCLGNICRSPSAENIMNHLIAQQGLSDQILCDSAGTSGYHVGSSPDLRMSTAAQRQGITLTGRSRQFTAADFETFDLILVMDRNNYQDVLSLDSSNRHSHNVELMCDYCQRHSDQEVPDPYYGGEAGFDYVIDLLTDACEGLLASLKS